MFKYARLIACIAPLWFASETLAQNYPSAPVKLIVSVPAGGITDAMARVIGQRLQEKWRQTVVVENRPGGNYGVGAQAVERSQADGLTLLVAPDTTFTANPALFSKLIYDPNGFTPISFLCRSTPMLVVHPSVPVKSVPELISYAKANPGKLSYGSFGIGTYAHLSMEEFKRRTGTELQHVPYRGAAPALNGILGNEVSVILLSLSTVEAHAKDGKLRLLAAATEKRASVMPELSTVSEFLPGFQTSVWFGLWGPSKMPSEIVEKINNDVSSVLAMPEMRAFLKANSFEPDSMPPQEFAKLIKSDLQYWSELINVVGAKIE